MLSAAKLSPHASSVVVSGSPAVPPKELPSGQMYHTASATHTNHMAYTIHLARPQPRVSQSVARFVAQVCEPCCECHAVNAILANGSQAARNACQDVDQRVQVVAAAAGSEAGTGARSVLVLASAVATGAAVGGARPSCTGAGVRQVSWLLP